MEIWKDVIAYEGLYQVSSIGRVKSLMGRWGMCFLKPQLQTNERKERFYYKVTLYKDGVAKKKSIHILMADAFFGVDPTKVTDHKDNISTNNILSNLQRVTNRVNVSKDRVGTSKFTGVSWHKGSRKWQANIKFDGKIHFLGKFDIEEMAEMAYNHELEKLKTKSI